MTIVLVCSIIALLALAYGGFLIMGILSSPAGSEKMQSISQAIREGAMAYLNRQYRTISIFAVLIFLILGFVLGWKLAIGFIVGAFFSALAGYIGMNTSVRANVRTAEAAKSGMDAALRIAFRGGSVNGLAVVGLALFGVGAFYMIYHHLGVAEEAIPGLLIGFGFGASLISLFARLGGGIYTKAADVGADLVGKVEAGIPEDDPRNPAVIADNVGDNVGDCAGMGADLFETYVVTLIAAMVSATAMQPFNNIFVFFPILLGGIAVIATIVGTWFIRLGKSKNIMAALYQGMGVTAALSLVGFYVATTSLGLDMSLFYCSLIGVAVTIAMIVITEYYTATKYRPVQSVAEASVTGAGTNIIIGLAAGLESTLFPMLVVCGAILGAYWLGGIYGIAISAVAMLSSTGMIIAMDTYGPITDNGGGIAEMAGLAPEVRKVTDTLDAVGNTTKAVTKGYAIASAAIAALVLFQDYSHALGGSIVFNMTEPILLVGLFIGALLPFIFSAMCLKAVGRAAHGIVAEVRRQFREIPGIMEGTGRPEYGKCVDIVTSAALKEMVLPAMLAVITPLLVGFILGPVALGGLLVGVIASGFLVAIQMANGGATWDNAKKYIEDGHFGGKGSVAHMAAVVGDTVGDPYKDTAGPALNALIKVINMVAFLIAPLIVTWSLLK